MTNKTLIENTAARNILKALSVQDFKNFGLHQIAYIRSVSENSSTSYKIHSADGEELLSADTLEVAIVIAKQNDLEPIILQ